MSRPAVCPDGGRRFRLRLRRLLPERGPVEVSRVALRALLRRLREVAYPPVPTAFAFALPHVARRFSAAHGHAREFTRVRGHRHATASVRAPPTRPRNRPSPRARGGRQPRPREYARSGLRRFDLRPLDSGSVHHVRAVSAALACCCARAAAARPRSRPSSRAPWAPARPPQYTHGAPAHDAASAAAPRPRETASMSAC